MTEERTQKKSGLGSYFPHRRAMIAVIAVALVAFAIGMMFGGGDGAPSAGGADNQAQVDAEPTTWTCSMHPQIQLPEPGKCPICFMDLIPLESGDDAAELDPNQLKMSETARQLARIQTAEVRRGFAEREIRLVGRLAYDETRLSYITAWVPGRLDRLFADFTGVRVAKGDHMVSIYSPELLAAQEELIQAREALKALSGSSSILRSTAQSTVEAAREKLRLFGLTENQIDSVENADVTDDHLTLYAPIGGVVVEKHTKEGQYVETGARIYTIADLSQLWAMFEAYESDLPWLRYGQRIEFTSPSFPGDVFTAIITFIDPVIDPKTRTARVRAIVENKNGRLKPDMFVTGIVHSRLDAEGNVIDDLLAGKWISPMHPQVVKEGPGQCDVCGMDLVKAEDLGYSTMSMTDKKAPLLIPASAPLLTGTRAVVYVQLSTPDGPIFEGREVRLGPRAGDFYVVKEGIEEGEEVVTNGAFKIDAELQIQAKPSMMSLASESADDPAREQSEVISTMEISADARRALDPIYGAYFQTQMALANDDLDATRSGYADIAGAVEGTDMMLFEDQAHDLWMKLAVDISTAAENGMDANDFDEARTWFRDLSEDIIDLHTAFGHSGSETFYLTYCPMAFDNDGAYWMQTENVVWNSFYGEAMLRCGEIKDSLPPDTEVTE